MKQPYALSSKHLLASRLELSLLFILASMSSGCVDTGGDLSNLGTALSKAREVVETYLPGAQLDEIIGTDIQGDGTVSISGHWTFYYYKENEDGYDYYLVSVYPGGKVEHNDPGNAICHEAIPNYESAALWITEADKAIRSGGISFTQRDVQVWSDQNAGCDGYAGVENLAVVYYYESPEDEPINVVLDADNGTFLELLRP